MLAGLQIQHLLVATIAPSQASTLVKELGQASPLPGLQHLKRIHRLTTGNSSSKALEIILHALHSEPDTGHEYRACTTQQLAAMGVPAAVIDIVDKHSLEARLAQVMACCNLSLCIAITRVSPTSCIVHTWNAFKCTRLH